MLSIAMAVMSLPCLAQGKYGADSAECIKYLSYYKEYFKQRNFDDAAPSWKSAYKLCPPQASYNLYVDGATIVRRLIAKAGKDEAHKKALIDTLMELYDIRVANYPKYAVASRNNKGMDVHNFVKDDDKRVYDITKEIIDANGAKTKGDIYVYNLEAAIALFNAGKMSAEDILDTYQKSLEAIESAEPLDETSKTALEGLFATSKVASCEDLLALFTPKFQADPENLQLVNSILKMMAYADDCINNDLYLRAAATKYRLDPNAAAAYALYRLNAAQGNTAEAIRYMEESIASDETDVLVDIDYTFQLATYCFKSGRSARAFDLAKNVLSMDTDGKFTGKAYFLIGQIWSACNCADGDEMERRAPYWVAIDYFIKAKAADETLAEEANKFIGQYSKYYPQTADAFMYNLTKGESYTARCGGMVAVTTVRTQD